MFTQSQAAVLHGAKDLRLETRSLKPPAANEAQVAVKATGLCGSDLHYYLHGKNGDFVLREPMALGHESAGVVTAVGEGVNHIRVGQRVAIEAGAYCNTCRLCKSGRYNLCPKMRFASSAKVYPHQDGTLQTLINHPASLLHKIPDSCTFEQASLVEPLSVVLHASRRAQIRAGQSVMVMGAGAVGILACAVVKASGASKVTIVDINEDRINFAIGERFAQHAVTLPMKPRPDSALASLTLAKELAELILRKDIAAEQDFDGYDIVLECTGVESCMQTAIHLARPGGKVVFIGMGTSNATLPISAAAFREVDLLGVFRYANTYPEALAMFEAGHLKNVEKLVTNRFPLDKVNEAFETLQKGVDAKGNMVIKVMVGDY